MREPLGWLLSLLVALLVAAVALAGCSAGGTDAATGIDDDYMDDPPPPGGCAATGCGGSSGGSSPVGGPCLHSSDCVEGAFCAAQFDGQVGSFTCRAACIELMDDTQWCADESACCSGMCSPRGYCVPPGETEGLDGTGSADSSGAGSTGHNDTGSSTGEPTGSSSGTGPSTGTG